MLDMYVLKKGRYRLLVFNTGVNNSHSSNNLKGIKTSKHGQLRSYCQE